MRLETGFIVAMLIMSSFSCSRKQHSIYSLSLLMLEDSLDVIPEKSVRQILEIDTSSLRGADKAFY